MIIVEFLPQICGRIMSRSRKGLMTAEELITAFKYPTGYTLSNMDEFLTLVTYVHHVYINQTKIEEILKKFENSIKTKRKLSAKYFTKRGEKISSKDSCNLAHESSDIYHIRTIEGKIISDNVYFRMSEVGIKDYNYSLIIEHFQKESRTTQERTKSHRKSLSFLEKLQQIFPKRSDETVSSSIKKRKFSSSNLSNSEDSLFTDRRLSCEEDSSDEDHNKKFIGDYLNKVEYLGPVIELTKEGADFAIAETYKDYCHREWKRLYTSPQVTTKIWSAPYLVCKSYTGTNTFLVMFSLENHTAEEFKFRTKVLDSRSLKERLILPFNFDVILYLKTPSENASESEFVELKRGTFTCEEVDKYSEDMIVPFKSTPKETFPILKVQVVK